MKKIFFILGMHRSATSLTANILSNYGMYAGPEEDLLEANKSNEHGFFENKNVFLLDETIWCEHGIYSSSCITKRIDLFKETKYRDEIEGIIQDLCENSEKNQNIFIKDPRMCLLEPLWRKEVNKYKLEENIIVVFRHPFEVAKSLQKRDNMNFTYALKLWFYYNLSILYCIKNCTIPVLVLHHEDYFTSKVKQINKLENFIGYKNNKIGDLVDISLRHNVVENISETINSELKNMIFQLYEYLISLANSSSVIISKNNLKQYEIYLKKMVSTSYDNAQKDMAYINFTNTYMREKKTWCIYQMYNKRKALVLKFETYFKKHEITQIYIYGNGTITEALLPIINKTGIIIKRIFDKKDKNYIENLQNADSEMYLLNTVVYNNDVLKLLLKYFNTIYILDIYKLLNELIFE